MKRGMKLTALLLAMLLLVQSAAFATEQTGGISLYSLDDESYAVMQTGAEELAAVSDTVLGIGQIKASGAKMCTEHYLPEYWHSSELIATLDQGTFVTVYAGEYNGALSGVISGSWMKIAYNGQVGYVQTDYLALCTCENVTELVAHTDSCPEKQYVKYFCDNSTAQELYDNWSGYSDEQKEFALIYLSWGQQDKLNELNALLKENAPLVDTELDKTVGGNTITLNGSLLEGTTLQFDETSEAKEEALAGMLDLSGFADGVMTYAFEIGLEHDGSAYQPKEKVQITLSGIGTEEAAASEDYVVEVYHFLDTAEAVEKALADGTAIAMNVEGQAAQFADELAASGVENTVYYTRLSSMDYNVSIDGASVSFEADSFSTYYLASGITKTSENYSPFGSAIVVMDGSDAGTGTTKIYAMPGTTITFYAYTKDGTVKGTWMISSDNAKLDVSKMPSSANHECTIIVPSGATTVDNGKYTRLKVQYTVSGTTYTRYADIYVASLQTVVTGAVNSWNNSAAPNYELYLTCLKDPKNGIPGEPGVNERQFNVDSTIGGTFKNPATYIKLDAYLEAVKQSYDATNTLGVVDNDGAGTTIKNVLNFSAAQWNSLLVSFANAKAWDGGNIQASDGAVLAGKSADYIKANYVLVPYILKLQTANGYSFNLDCYIKAKNSYTLKYDMNLPNSLVLSNVQTPNSVVKKERFTATVATATYGSDNITVNKLITLQDSEGNSYRYVFLGWDTKADGTGTRYLPGGSITVPPTGWTGTGDYTEILYAQWARVGDLKITKTVQKQDATNTADPDLSREFTMTVTMKQANGNPLTGSYSYTVGSGTAQTLKLNANGVGEIKLKHGQTATIINLPAGATYTVTEEAVTDFVTAYSDNDGTATDGKGTIGADTTDTVAVTNTYTKLRTASLTIEKKVSGPNDASNPDFTFEILLTDADNAPLTGSYSVTVDGTARELTFDENGMAEITLKKDQTAVISGIPVTSKYTVTEKNLPLGYSIDGSSQNGTVEVNGTNKAVFTNTYETGSLAISKTVVGKDAPSSDTFTFTVGLPAGTFNYTIGQTTGTIADGGTITLAHGQTATITGIPAGATYTVTETEDDDYTTTKPVESGEITANAPQTAAFTNTYKTGILAITKRGLTGNDHAIFNVTVTKGDYNKTFRIVMTNETVTLADLPYNATYTVAEESGWAWRYGTTTITYEDQGKTIDYNETDTVTVVNEKTENKWLDFEEAIENLFNGVQPSEAPNS